MRATRAEFVAVFTEWQRRWIENPERFDDCETQKGLAPDTYGEKCVTYFQKLLAEIKKGKQ